MHNKRIRSVYSSQNYSSSNLPKSRTHHTEFVGSMRGGGGGGGGGGYQLGICMGNPASVHAVRAQGYIIY